MSPRRARRPWPRSADGGGDAKGAPLYLTYCGLCHGAAGQGVPNVFPLRGSATVAEPDGVNLVDRDRPWDWPGKG